MPICEMCGREAGLVLAEIEGGELNVCAGCAKYGLIKKRPEAKRFVPSAKTRFAKKEDVEYKVVANYSRLIRSARESKSMKQEDFAKFLNEKESIVAKWESGTLKPRINVARRLEKVLGIKLVEKDEIGSLEMEKDKKHSDEFTLGDFVKVRRRS